MRKLFEKEEWYIFNDKYVCFWKFIADGFMDCLQSKVNSLSAGHTEYSVLLNDPAFHNAIAWVGRSPGRWVDSHDTPVKDSVGSSLALLNPGVLNECHWPMPFSTSISWEATSKRRPSRPWCM